MIQLISQIIRRRRKEGATCFHCGEPIQKGARYHDQRYTDNGRVYQINSHDHCMEWFDAGVRHGLIEIDDNGIMEGMLVELLDEAREQLEWLASKRGV